MLHQFFEILKSKFLHWVGNLIQLLIVTLVRDLVEIL